MAWKITAEAERFEEAIRFFATRTLITAKQARELTARAKLDAFWIGGGMQLRQVQRVFDRIQVSIDNGEPFEEFRKAVKDKFKSAQHLEVTYRNAVQRSYGAGRYEQLTDPTILKVRPFWLLDVVVDEQTSTICRPVAGTILPVNHPWFLRNWPPRHHACRSGVRSLTEREAKRRGISDGPPDGEADEGFGATPGTPANTNAIKPKPEKHDKQIFQELERKAKKIDSRPALIRRGAEAAKFLESDGAITRGKAREVFREQIQEVLPGAMPSKLANRGLLVVDDALMAKYKAEGALEWDGTLEVKDVIRKDGAFAFKKLAQGRKLAPHQQNAIRVLIHEELHGHSRVSKQSYQGVGKLLEEIGTELNARRVVAHVTGKAVGGSYQNWIDSVAKIVGSELGLLESEALDRIADAQWRGIMMHTSELADSDEHLTRWLAQLDATPTQRKLIGKRLKKAAEKLIPKA